MKADKSTSRSSKKIRRRSDVMIAIWRAGYGLRDIAEGCSCTISFASAVANGDRTSARVQKYIADLLHRDVDKLFPRKKAA